MDQNFHILDQNFHILDQNFLILDQNHTLLKENDTKTEYNASCYVDNGNSGNSSNGKPMGKLINEVDDIIIVNINQSQFSYKLDGQVDEDGKWQYRFSEGMLPSHVESLMIRLLSTNLGNKIQRWKLNPVHNSPFFDIISEITHWVMVPRFGFHFQGDWMST